MNLRHWILWKPEQAQRAAFFAVLIGVTLLLDWVHYLAGFAYELHVLFCVLSSAFRFWQPSGI
jgi:hypothetical protein